MGMKLSLACALAHNPDLLILDEATAGLDPMAREEALDTLRGCTWATSGRGILMSSHITSDLEKIADYIVCIDAGRIVFSVEKDVITDVAGVAQCRAAEFERHRGQRLLRPAAGCATSAAPTAPPSSFPTARRSQRGSPTSYWSGPTSKRTCRSC